MTAHSSNRTEPNAELDTMVPEIALETTATAATAATMALATIVPATTATTALATTTPAIGLDGDKDLARSISALSRLVMLDAELPTTLTYIADFAVRAIPGADGAGLTLFQEDRPDTVVASAPFVREADALQYGIGEGPCITATTEGRTVRSGALDQDAEFPVFGPRAAALGLHSTLSLPLLTGTTVLGSINVYARAQNAFDDRAAELGELFAVPAAISVQNAQALSQAQRLATLQQAAMTGLDRGRELAINGRDSALDVAHVARQQTAYANASKQEFLSRISHELRTPLNAVLGFAQLLELDALSSVQKDSVEHILHSGRQLLTMIEDVFDIAAIDSDRLEVPLRPVAFSELLSDAIIDVLPLAVASQVDVEYHPHPFDPPPYVEADPARVTQVLDNVLTNAIKFNHPGGRVDVSCSLSHRSGLSVAITDTGCGIAAVDLPRLFTPFDRLGRSSDIDGSGVGLALSQRLITLMGGELRVETTPGRGSTFTINFPLTTAPRQPAEPIAVAAPAEHTMLYIEDDDGNVDLMTSILRKRPMWNIVRAGLGTDGLTLGRTTRPSLVLLDLRLPDMTGIAVLQQLRTDPITADIPVVVVSADADPAQVRRLRAAGASGYLTKPLDVADVLDLLDRHARRPVVSA